MKKFLSVSLCIAGFTSLFAGGIVTNTNQSASWVRNPSTAAYTGIEATYYNPAATTKLGEGLFFSLSNQSIFQNREITNSYSFLNDNTYKGEIKAMVFPSIYAVYNVSKFSFSFGFNPIGGGGGAEFKKGLPTIELPPSTLVPSLQAAGVSTVTGYSLESYFKGTSIYFGYQFGVSYKINDMMSVYAGLRYVTAKNTYEGYLRNIKVNNGGSWMPASTLLAGLAANANAMIAIPSSLQPIVDGGGGSLTLAQAESAGYLPPANRTAIEQGLAAIGVPAANISAMNITQVQGAFTLATPTLQTSATEASIKSKLLRDQQANVEQTGSGISPIIGINLTPVENLNIGIKYEFATKMDIKNKTKMDFVIDSLPGLPATTMFPDGAKTPSDMPSLLSVGVSYKMMNKLTISGSMYYYFDKSVSYGHKMDDGSGNMVYVSNDKLIKDNFLDLALGLDYSITDKILVSAGYLYGKTGVKPEYNNDLSYSNSSSTFGFGGKYSVNKNLDINLGFGYTMYDNSSKTLPEYANAVETYKKSTTIIGVGVDLKFGK